MKTFCGQFRLSEHLLCWELWKFMNNNSQLQQLKSTKLRRTTPRVRIPHIAWTLCEMLLNFFWPTNLPLCVVYSSFFTQLTYLCGLYYFVMAEKLFITTSHEDFVPFCICNKYVMAVVQTNLPKFLRVAIWLQYEHHETFASFLLILKSAMLLCFVFFLAVAGTKVKLLVSGCKKFAFAKRLWQ